MHCSGQRPVTWHAGATPISRPGRAGPPPLPRIVAWLALAGWALLVALPPPQPASAQTPGEPLELLGVAWDHTTITYSLRAEAGVPPAALAQVRAAIREWNARFARLENHFATLRLAPSTGAGADVPITLRARTGSSLGVTSPALAYQTAGCWLLQAPIALDVLDADGNVLPDDWLFTTAAHEIGHALGLGHAAATDDLMYHQYSEGRRAPSALNLRGIRTALPWLASAGSTPETPRCPRVRGVR
jgi:hypothetical protein